VKVSFVIPLYNCLPLTQVMLASLQATLPRGLDHEIILVDDGSTDGTREWLATLAAPPFVVRLNSDNRGYAHANNTGARLARGRFLALLNNDLVFARDWLEPMLAAFRRFSDTGIVGNLQFRAATGGLDHAGLVIDPKGRPEHLDHRRGWLLLPNAYSVRPAVTGACCLVERERFLALGGFDEGFINGGEDVDLCYLLRRAGLKVRVANRSRVLHHVSASPGRKARDEQNSRRLCRKWREQLIEDGARFWPHVYLHEHWLNPREYDHALLFAAVPRILGLTRRPSPRALDLVARNIDLEEQRWLEMFGPMSISP
jgi:GT2 family glycosyltransferase